MVLSPEHELVRQWLESGAITNPDEVRKYQAEAAAKSDLERTELNKDMTGVRTMGVDAVNPVNGEVIPSSSPTTSSRATARAPSWPSRATTSATGSSRRSSACP